MSEADGVSVTFELHMRPEAVDGFVAATPGMLGGTAAFPGFRDLRIVQHKDDPARILFLETWDSEQAYKDYIAWRTGQGSLAGLQQAVTATETNIWPKLVAEARSAQPIPATEGVSITFALRLEPEAVAPFTAGGAQLMKDVAGFAGFRGIRMVQHKEDPARVLFIERWDSEADYKAYVAWQTERGAMKALEGIVSSAETNVWPRLVAHA